MEVIHRLMGSAAIQEDRYRLEKWDDDLVYDFIFFSLRVVRHYNKLSREDVDTQSLEKLKTPLD